MRLEIQGRIVEVGDEFAKLSPEEKQRTVDEIAASMAPQAKAEPSKMEQFFQAARPETGLAASMMSAVNSALLGAPEMIARQFGAGPAIEATRQEYPFYTATGDVAGLAAPASVGMKLAGKGMNALASRFGRAPAPTQLPTGAPATTVPPPGQLPLSAAQEQNRLMRVMRRPETPPPAAAAAETAPAAARVSMPPGSRAAASAPANLPAPALPGSDLQRYLGVAARTGGKLAGGLLGAQTGAGTLGAARDTEDPERGFMTGALNFQRAATNLPGVNMVPGAGQVISTTTGAIPGVVGFSQLAQQYARVRQQQTREDQIREEAWKRAMRGPQ